MILQGKHLGKRSLAFKRMDILSRLEAYLCASRGKAEIPQKRIPEAGGTKPELFLSAGNLFKVLSVEQTQGWHFVLNPLLPVALISFHGSFRASWLCSRSSFRTVCLMESEWASLHRSANTAQSEGLWCWQQFQSYDRELSFGCASVKMVSRTQEDDPESTAPWFVSLVVGVISRLDRDGEYGVERVLRRPQFEFCLCESLATRS